MALPNLLIVGAAKSGTTSLHNYLNQHPEVFMCNPKEPHFLINKEIGLKRILVGIDDFQEYEKLFFAGKENKYRGESSVMYLMYPDIVIPKIKELFGDETKIIIMLRNPVDRAYSGFQHVKRYNVNETSTFEKAWEISEERYFSNTVITPASRYQELGLYYNQVKSYFEKLQYVHVIIYDDYKADFKGEMHKVFDFLAIDKININIEERHMIGDWQWENDRMKKIMIKKNSLRSFLKIIIPFKSLRKMLRIKIKQSTTNKVLEMKKETRQMLQEFYKEDVANLSELLDRDLNYWTQ
ncbi:MAG TPA: sulfotransferase [Flavobacteriales bacterium]|jgi:hypothetical protein|nr:sulfotransferase [Flavobacteriales bacterium]|tara:strand:- start:1698 stop:2585 length:888 start_codon:yes stop_codon:yes gene_type:complete